MKVEFGVSPSGGLPDWKIETRREIGPCRSYLVTRYCGQNGHFDTSRDMRWFVFDVRAPRRWWQWASWFEHYAQTKECDVWCASEADALTAAIRFGLGLTPTTTAADQSFENRVRVEVELQTIAESLV